MFLVNDSSTDTQIMRCANHVYFYAEITSTTILQLIKLLHEADDDQKQQLFTPDRHPKVVHLHLNSPGGDLLSAFAGADTLGTLTSQVYSYVEGFCGSAATIISVVCDKRYIMPNAMMMIHQVWSEVRGKYDDFEDDLGAQRLLMSHMVRVYKRHTNMKKKQIKRLLKRDSWLNATQAVQLGLADEVLHVVK